MTIVTAKHKVKSKTFEVSVNFEEALKVQKKTGDIIRALNVSTIFYNAKEGSVASQQDLMDAFQTSDTYAVATTIIQRGELQKPQEFRDAEREARVKQVVALLVRNAVDQHGRPYTEDRLRRAIGEIQYSFDSRSAEKQMIDVLDKLKTVIPIKIETKRIRLRIPARFSGTVYGFLKDYKQQEDWLPNGDLEVVVALPAGLQLDFYDKLNSVTHGAVVSEELKD